MRNAKLTTYKNSRYLEMMKALLDEYGEIITVDVGDIYLSDLYNKESEKRVIEYIYDALKKTKYNKSLIISLSMPLISRELLYNMGKIEFQEDVLIPYTEGELQKFCAVYDKKILNKIEHIIENEDISFESLFNNTSIRYIFPKDKGMFIDIDKLEKYITYYM